MTFPIPRVNEETIPIGSPSPTSLLAPLLDLFAEIKVSIGGVKAEIAKANAIEQAKLNNLPNYVPLTQTFSDPAATTALLDFGGPQSGRCWNVRLLSAVASPLATNATQITWYVGQRMPGPGAGMLPPSMVRWQSASVPAFENFGSEIIKILAGEHLIAGLTGIPALSILYLNAVIHDQPMGVGHGTVAE